MNKQLERFQQGQMTASSEGFLAATYGGGATIDEFAASLPSGAMVADVGAGLSHFGVAVGQQRDDVRWTNIDLNYDGNHPASRLLTRVMATAPPNVDYETADVFDLPEEMIGQYDRVYSYRLVTHLIRINRGLGRQAVTGLVSLLNTGGELMIGPTNTKTADGNHEATALRADAGEVEIEKALDLLTGRRVANLYYDAAQISGVGLYPAKRFNPDSKRKFVLSDNGGQTWHPIPSIRGAVLATRLAAGAFRS